MEGNICTGSRNLDVECGHLWVMLPSTYVLAFKKLPETQSEIRFLMTAERPCFIVLYFIVLRRDSLFYKLKVWVKHLLQVHVLVPSLQTSVFTGLLLMFHRCTYSLR